MWDFFRKISFCIIHITTRILRYPPKGVGLFEYFRKWFPFEIRWYFRIFFFSDDTKTTFLNLHSIYCTSSWGIFTLSNFDTICSRIRFVFCKLPCSNINVGLAMEFTNIFFYDVLKITSIYQNVTVKGEKRLRR